MKGLTYILKLEEMTSAQLAEKIGVSVSVMYRWEKGNTKIPQKRIEQFQQLFPIYPDNMFDKEIDEIDMITLKIVHIKHNMELWSNIHNLEAMKRRKLYSNELEYNINLLRQQTIINKMKSVFDETQSLSLNINEGLSVRQNMIDDFKSLCEIEEKYITALMMGEQGKEQFKEISVDLKQEFKKLSDRMNERLNTLSKLDFEDYAYIIRNGDYYIDKK